MARATTPRTTATRSTSTRRRGMATPVEATAAAGAGLQAEPNHPPTLQPSSPMSRASAATIHPSEPSMAINALLGSVREPEPYAATMPIGEEDRNIFACPVCMRPLAVGVRRCPGCRTRLVMATPVRRAVAFVSTGLVAGVLAGGGMLGAMGAVAGLAGDAVPSRPPAVTFASPSPAPQTAAPSTTPPASVPPAVQPAARAALGQVGTLHVRLLDAARELRTELQAATFDASAVAQTLRSMNSNASFGIDVAGRLRSWDAAESLSAELEGFYADIRATARAALAASVRNEVAYSSAATKMLILLGRLEVIDPVARALAVTAEVELPALDLDILGTQSGATSTP